MRIKPKSVKGSILLILAIVIFVTVVTYSTGIANSRSAWKIGYVGNNGWDTWSGHYTLLDGKMQRTLHFDNSNSKDIALVVKTESGKMSVEIKDKTGNVLFSQSDIGTISRSISVNGNIVVTITADKHKGSFAIN